MAGKKIVISTGNGMNTHDALIYAATVFNTEQCPYSEIPRRIGRVYSVYFVLVNGIIGEVWRTLTGYKIALRKEEQDENQT